MSAQKTYVSSRKLESLPDGSIVEFVGGMRRWRKKNGKWIFYGSGIPFSSKGLINYENGRRFVVKQEGKNHG